MQPVPEVIRLRRLLKAAVRSFGFRCVSVERLEETEPKKDKTKNATDIS